MQQIIAKVFAQNTNGHGAMSCTPARPINCSNAVVEGMEWMVPFIQDGKNLGYRRVISATKPSADSVKTLRVNTGGQTYWLQVKDGDTDAVFANACNACCDDGTPTIATDAIPEPIIEDAGEVDEDGNYTYYANIPTLATGQKMTISMSFNNGTAASPVVDSAGFTTAAGLLSWLNTNWGNDVGTFSLVSSSKLLKLVSPNATALSMFIDLKAAAYCGTVSFPMTIDTVVHNGVTNVLAAPVTLQNFSEFVQTVGNYFADGTLSAFSATKINYLGTGVPTLLKLGSTTVHSFSAGACA